MRDVNARDMNAGHDIIIYDRSNTGAKSVQLEIDPDSKQWYPKTEVERRAVRGGIVLGASLFTSVSAIFADYVGILSHFGISGFMTTVAPAAIALAGGLILRINGDNEFVAWRLRRPKRPNEPRPISLQRYLELDDVGNYLISSRTAPCIYPKCRGTIIAKNLPPREVSRDGLAGVCSVAGNAHSYLIDRNWVAREQDLDWRPPPPRLRTQAIGNSFSLFPCNPSTKIMV